MSNLRQAAKQALEALEHSLPFHETVERLEAHNKAITALRAALEEQEQEPVAWMDREGDLYKMPEIKNWAPPHTMLYTAPPQRLPLTNEEIVEAVREADLDWQAGWTLDEDDPNRFTTLTRAIEAAHGIKGDA